MGVVINWSIIKGTGGVLGNFYYSTFLIVLNTKECLLLRCFAINLKVDYIILLMCGFESLLYCCLTTGSVSMLLYHVYFDLNGGKCGRGAYNV